MLDADAVRCGLAAALLVVLAPLPGPVRAHPAPEAPAVVVREHRAPGASAQDGRPLTLALLEKHRADLDPDALAASGRVVLLTQGEDFSGQAAFDVQVPGVDPVQSYSVLDQLALWGYDAWTLAVQNYGASDGHACGRCVTTEAGADDVEAAVRYIRAARRADRVHLLGWSWGGQTAGLVAQRHPEWVNRLVLTAPLLDRPAGDPPPPAEEFRPSAPGLAGLFFAPAAAPEVVAALREGVLTTEPLAPSGPIVAWRTAPQAADPDRITVPTLVIYGADDAVTPPDGPSVGAFFGRLAAAEKRFVLVPGAGHALFLERQRARWYEAVLAHLAPGNTPLAP